MPTQYLSWNDPQKVLICIRWNGILPKNSPQWIKDLDNSANTVWQETEISGRQVFQLFNFGIDIMMSRDSLGRILISLNEQGQKFGQR